MPTPMDRVGVGVIGCGDIARQAHLPAYARLPDVDIVGVADVDVAAARQAAQEFGVRQAFADYDSLLALPEVQAVSICTPHSLHHPVAIAAACAGKHILCEKPMAVSLAQAQEMVRVARERGVLLATCFPWKYYELHTRVKELIERGTCGPVQRVVHRRGASSAAWLHQEAVSRRPWLTDAAAAGGGLLIGQSVHYLSYLLWWVEKRPLRVWADTRTLSHLLPEGFDDSILVVIECEGGVQVVLDNTYCYVDPMQEVVVGTEGTIRCHHPHPWDITVNPGQPGETSRAGRSEEGSVVARAALDDEPAITDSHYRWRPLIADFVASIRAGTIVGRLSTAEDGLLTQAVIEAAYRSSRERREVACGV